MSAEGEASHGQSGYGQGAGILSAAAYVAFGSPVCLPLLRPGQDVRVASKLKCVVGAKPKLKSMVGKSA
jgi:hypothetical protein